eukprot:TRINITY_DN2347_c0_g1_i12.p1 TRINITY_DN2347_c0_g1~~TRINITY_DN2347_c0_g1_i12.p1  ORF type:complete len:206 (-),score=-15.16 TRINITY_DN2347_c0_g1_i12:164-781(-)
MKQFLYCQKLNSLNRFYKIYFNSQNFKYIKQFLYCQKLYGLSRIYKIYFILRKFKYINQFLFQNLSIIHIFLIFQQVLQYLILRIIVILVYSRLYQHFNAELLSISLRIAFFLIFVLVLSIEFDFSSRKKNNFCHENQFAFAYLVLRYILLLHRKQYFVYFFNPNISMLSLFKEQSFVKIVFQFFQIDSNLYLIVGNKKYILYQE